MAINWMQDEGHNVERTEQVGAFTVRHDVRKPVALVLKPDGTVIVNGTTYQIDEWPVVRGRQNLGAHPPINVRRPFMVGRDWDDQSK